MVRAFLSPRLSGPIVPMGEPYEDGAKSWSIVRTCAAGRVIDGEELEKLKSALKKTLGVEGVLLCGSGSLAIELALRALAVGCGDEVIIPAFCCTTVAASVVAVGAVPVLADAGPELNITAETVAPVLSQKTKAVIVPHLFGNPADIEAIADLAKEKNIALIDDAAQALGGEIEGRPLGSFGDAGVVSFGRQKICSGIGGGALVSRNGEIVDRASKFALAKPHRVQTLSRCLSALVDGRWKRLSNDGPNGFPIAYHKEKLANVNAAVAFSLVQKLRDNVARRRARVRLYQRLLRADGHLELIKQRKGSACLTQLARIMPRNKSDDAACRVIEHLRKEGYEAHGSYVPIHLLSGNDRCVWDRLSTVEKVWPDMIELPCEPELSLSHVMRIASIVKRAV